MTSKRYTHTPLSEQRRKSNPDVRAFFDLVPDEWEKQRKKIMKELNSHKRHKRDKTKESCPRRSKK